MKKQIPPSEAPKRKTPWLFILILVGGGLYVLQKAGLKSIDRSETESPIDFNSAEFRNRTAPPDRVEDPKDENATLRNIDEVYGGEQITTMQPSEKAGLGSDEQTFYDALRQLYAGQPDMQNRENWLAQLKTSRTTYRKVRAAFEAVSTSELDETQLTPIINNEAIRTRISAALETQMALPKGALSGFKGLAVSDWALEIERQSMQ